MGPLFSFGALAAALTIESSIPAPLRVVEPSAAWRVDYADSMCSLSRQFGDLKTGLILGFRPAPLSDNFRVAVLIPDTAKKVSRGKAQLHVGVDPPVEAPFARGPVEIDNLNIAAIDATREQLIGLSKASTLRIAAGDINVEFKLTGMAKALMALDACEQDLLVAWGMDPKVVASLASYPTHRGGLISLFSTDDYPREAVINREQGTTGVRIKVSKDGKVSDCQIIESSGSDAIDKQTCKVIENRARFRPARTKSGDAVDSIALQRVVWEMPE